MVKTLKGNGPVNIVTPIDRIISAMLGTSAAVKRDTASLPKSPILGIISDPDIRNLMKGNRGTNVKTIFNAMAIRISDSNPALIFQGMKDLNGASAEISCDTNGAINIAAGNKARVTGWADISLAVIGRMTDSVNPVFVDYRLFNNFESTAPFALVPFLVMAENGETYTNVDVNSINIDTIIAAGLPAATNVVQFGPVGIAKRVRENGSNVYMASMNWDLGAICNAYAVHAAKKQIEEEDPLYLAACFAVVGVASQSISSTTTSSVAYYLRKKEMF